LHCLASLMSALVGACGSVQQGQLVEVGQVENRAQAEARLEYGTMRHQTPWCSSPVKIVFTGPAAPVKQKPIATSHPSPAPAPASAVVSPETEVTAAGGRTSAASATGRTALVGRHGHIGVEDHIPVANVAANASSCVLGTVPLCLAVVKVPDRPDIQLTEPVWFTITVTNYSALAVRDLVVTDSYGQDLTVLECEGRGVARLSADGDRSVQFHRKATLDVGQTVSYRVKVGLSQEAQEKFLSLAHGMP